MPVVYRLNLLFVIMIFGISSLVTPESWGFAEVQNSQNETVKLSLVDILSLHINDETIKFENTPSDYLRLLEQNLQGKENGNQEIREVKHAIVRLLENSSSSKNQAIATRLALEILAQAAIPTSINQGKRETCSLAAMEARLYTRHPGIPARVVVDAFLNGTITGKDQQTTIIDSQSLQPDEEALAPGIYGFKRSYASQLFQVALANLYWSRQTEDPRGNRVPLGSIKYIQAPQTTRVGFKKDSGERLIICRPDGTTEIIVGQNGLPVQGPEFSLIKILEAYQLLSTEEEHRFLIAHKSLLTNRAARHFDSPATLAKHLKELKAENALPAILAVKPGKTCFGRRDKVRFMSGSQEINMLPSFGSSNKWHAVCVTDIDDSGTKICVDNWWGPSGDRLGDNSLSTDTLYEATAPTKPGKQSTYTSGQHSTTMTFNIH